MRVALSALGRIRRMSWDRLGIGLSGVCLLHCMALPVSLALLPLWPVAGAVHLWLHAAFALVIVPTTAVAMWYGHKRHRSLRILLLLGVGLLVILSALVVGHEEPGGVTETAVTLAGSSLLILGHWRNLRSTGSCGLHPGRGDDFSE